MPIHASATPSARFTAPTAMSTPQRSDLVAALTTAADRASGALDLLYARVGTPARAEVHRAVADAVLDGIEWEDQTAFLARGDGHCPRCGSDSITGHSTDMESGTVSQTVTCNDCEASWRNVYTLDSYERT